MDPIVAEKEKLRRRILRLRDQQTTEQIEKKSLKIAGTVQALPCYQKAKAIACYVNKGSEVQTRPIIKKALVSGKKVLVPIVEKNSRDLIFSEINSLNELIPGTYGIPEPNPDLTRTKSLNITHLLLVPGIAWDQDGYRLGWGRGYFDTTLKRLPDGSTSIGLSFELQLVDRIPREQFDLPVDILVTENRVVHCHD
jgi:5-formyltetrahydrofolate cyclo-ligase